MKHVVRWEAFVVSGNPRVNREPSDQHRTLCAGWTVVEGTSPQAVIDRWLECFPQDRIVSVI